MAIDSGYTITPISGQNGTNGKDGQNGASVSVQYSVDGTSNWHDTFASGDKYMRQKVGTGNWSAAMKVVGEDGKDGDDGHTPTITADRSGDTVSIKSDGTEIAEITDGADGISLTSKGNWASGTAYKLMDVVYYTTNKTSYVCKKAHTASSSILPTNTTYWTVLAAPGTDGTNGTNGTNATQYYMHFVYCDDTSSGTNYSTTESRKYVGIYTDTTQADAATFDTAKAKSGIVWSKAEGEDGDDGTSVTITSKSVKYQAGSSGTTAPTGTWADAVPSVAKGQYLWTKTEVTYSDGTSTTSYSVGYAGTNGTNGTSPWTVTCSEPSLTLACGAEKTVTSEKSITIKFNAFQGTSRKAATITTSTLPSGVTVTSNTAATTSADGSLVLKIASGSNLGGTTAAYNTVIITLTVTANSVAYTFSLTLSKQISGQWQTAGWLDLTASTYDTNTWYPVTGTAMPKNPQKFQVSVRGDGQTNIPWSSHNTGKIGVEFCVEDLGVAWGWLLSNQCTIYSDSSSFIKSISGVNGTPSPVSYTQMTNSSTPVLWLRGGAKYYVEATYAVTWTIRTEATTISSQTVTPSANTRPTPRGVFVRGKGISTVAEYYKLSASTTETFDSGTINSWSTSPSSLVPTAAKPYLLNAERITLTDGVSTTYEYKTPHVCLTYQEDGADGRGITSITNVYKLTTNTTKPEAPAATDSVWTASATGSTSVWGTVCPTTTTANKYLWNCERIEFDDGTYTVTPVALMSTHGATGAQGGNGTDTWSPMLTSVTRSGNKFTKSTNTANWDSQFYSKEGFKRCFISWKVTQTNGAIMVGLNSDPAANANWTSLDYAIYFKTDGTYDIRESNTTVASSSGSYTTSNVFRIEFDGTKVNYYKGTTLLRSVARAEGTLLYADSSFYTYNKSIQDVSFGALGEKGATGKGVTSIVAYTALSTNSTKPAESAFTTSVKSLSSTNKYLWRYEVTTYTDNSTSGAYADATVIAVWGDKGDNAVSVTISSDTVDVMCGAGTGTFLGQQTKTITVYATKGNTRITSTITVPSESGGVKFTKTDGTDSANGAITLTLINGGNLGGNATKTASRTITVVADSISFSFVIKINKVSNGAYLGRCSAVPGNTNTISVYTHETTLLDLAVTKYALKGDFVSVVAGTNIGKIYQYNDSSWVLDTNTGHQTEAFSDLLMIPDSLPSDSASNQILNRLISNEVLAKRIKSLEVMFNNFVASITADSPSVGDLCISMGKNPKNPADNDHNFIIQSYKTKLSSNKELWHKEFFTKKNGNITDFNVNGKFNPTFGLETFCDIYSGCTLEQIPLSGTGLDIYVETDLIYLDGYFYNFNAPSQTELSIERASFSGGQLVFSNMTSYTNKGELYCVAAYKGNIYVSTSTGFYRFNTSTAAMTLISSSYKPAMMNEIDGKLNISSSIGVIALYNGSSIETHSVSAAYGLCEFSDGIYCTSNTYIPTEGGNYSSVSTFYFYDKSFNLLGSKTAIGKTINGKTVSAATAVFAANGVLFTSVYFSDRSYKTVVSYNGGDSWETAPINSVTGIKFFSYKSLIVIKGDSDCAYSYDGGRTWNSIPTADYTALNCGESFLVESDDAKFVYILVSDSSDKLNLYRLRCSNLSKNLIVAYDFGESSGYVKWSNGLLIQFMVLDNIGVKTLSLPTPYSNSNYFIFGSMGTGIYANEERGDLVVSPASENTFKIDAAYGYDGTRRKSYILSIGY